MTNEKTFLVRQDTEKRKDGQHSYHVREDSKEKGHDYQGDIYLSYEDALDSFTEDTSDDIYISYEVSRTFISLFLFPISVVLIVRADTA